MHELMAATLDTVVGEIQAYQGRCAREWVHQAPPLADDRAPHPKGWTCPKEIDGKRTEGYWRAHQVPMGEMHENPTMSGSSKSG